MGRALRCNPSRFEERDGIFTAIPHPESASVQGMTNEIQGPRILAILD